MKARYLAAGQYNAAVSITKLLVQGVGTYDACAAFTRVSKQHIARYCDKNAMEYAIPLDIIMDLEAVVNEPIVCQFLAAQLGYGLHKLPTQFSSDLDWKKHIQLALRFAEVTKDIASSLENDAIITAREITDKNMIYDLEQLAIVVNSLLEACKQKVADDG